MAWKTRTFLLQDLSHRRERDQPRAIRARPRHRIEDRGEAEHQPRFGDPLCLEGERIAGAVVALLALIDELGHAIEAPPERANRIARELWVLPQG